MGKHEVEVMGPPASLTSGTSEAPHLGLGSGCLIRHRPETKVLFLGNQEGLSLSLSFLLSLPPPPSFLPLNILFMPRALSTPLRAKLLETRVWKILFCSPPFTPSPEGSANSPSDGKGKGKEEKIINASPLMFCHSILLCSDGLRWLHHSGRMDALVPGPLPEQKGA